jgi:hypothetical protein
VRLSKTIDPVNFYIITNNTYGDSYTELAEQTGGLVVTNLNELNLLTDYIIERYDSLPRVEESDPVDLPHLEIEGIERISNTDVRVKFNTDGTKTLVLLNGVLLGVTDKNEITEGVIWKQLLFFFFPILLGTFFQQFYNTIDMVIVGRFIGKEALASVGGSSSMIVNVVVGFFTGLAAGSGVIISQFYGARNQKALNEAIHTAYAFSIVGSIVIIILGIFLSPSILEMMNTPAELMADSTVYLQIYFGGTTFIFIYNILRNTTIQTIKH